jgi:aspartate racemase
MNCRGNDDAMTTDLHIGLIGGIGPSATVVYYQRLVEAVRARGGRLELTVVHAQITDLVPNNLADRRAEQAAIYADLIDRLKAAGADCAAITSLGGHFCYEETVALSSLPLVSGVEPLDDAFVARGLARVGLLGTQVVMRTRLYGQLRRTEAVVLDEGIQTLGQLYQDTAVAGTCTPEARAAFFDAGRRLMDRGAQAIVLAGTDLGLAFDGRDPGYPIIDALDIHVERLADLATGRAALPAT